MCDNPLLLCYGVKRRRWRSLEWNPIQIQQEKTFVSTEHFEAVIIYNYLQFRFLSSLADSIALGTYLKVDSSSSS